MVHCGKVCQVDVFKVKKRKAIFVEEEFIEKGCKWPTMIYSARNYHMYSAVQAYVVLHKIQNK